MEVEAMGAVSEDIQAEFHKAMVFHQALMEFLQTHMAHPAILHHALSELTSDMLNKENKLRNF
jgi:rRNA pseudouridine-1189 N-methylase Emg1 (Nep1/Mra1 family)